MRRKHLKEWLELYLNDLNKIIEKIGLKPIYSNLKQIEEIFMLYVHFELSIVLIVGVVYLSPESEYNETIERRQKVIKHMIDIVEDYKFMFL